MIQQYINLFIIKTKENVKIGTLISNLARERKKKEKKEKRERQKALLGRIK